MLLSLLISSFVISGLSMPTSQHNRRNTNAVATTSTDTYTIDWVPIESQGEIADMPPARTPRNSSRPLAELEMPEAELGPSGTVPVPQVDPEYQSFEDKQLPTTATGPAKRQTSSVSGHHWYANSGQSVSNLGGSCIFSTYDAYTENDGDFSLLQVAVVRNKVNFTGSGSQSGVQTVEAGWQNFKQQVSQPHLFTFFNTNGYGTSGDYKNGYNQLVKGWIQVDNQIHPGSVFNLSVENGVQNDLKIEYLLYQNNWWLAVEDKWIGYYPASLFSNASTGTASSTLATGADTISYYGEVYNSETTYTTTDMGSGEFASAGYGKAAYIMNMTYTDTSKNTKEYNGDWSDSDTTRYTHDAHMLSGTSWGSYAFIGGPGAGGKIGA